MCTLAQLGRLEKPPFDTLVHYRQTSNDLHPLHQLQPIRCVDTKRRYIALLCHIQMRVMTFSRSQKYFIMKKTL